MDGTQAEPPGTDAGQLAERISASEETALTQAAKPQTQPPFVEVIKVLAEKADPLVKLLSAMLDRYQKGQEREVKFQTHMAWVTVSVVLAIIGVASFLTYVGKIDGSTFTFLLGLIVGYVLTFVRDQISRPE